MLRNYHDNAIHVEKIELVVKDLNRSLEYYTNNLGFSILKKEDSKAILSTNDKELITLYENKEAGSIDKKLGIYHFAILLPTRHDLSIFLKHLISKQIPITGAADHLVSEAIYMQDPDGIGIEIAIDKPQEYWNVETNSVPMDTKPFDYSGVYYASSEDELFTKLPKDTRIGHLHLQVKNLDQSSNFYQDVIGFQVTSKDFGGAVFLSDEKYHHHLALNTWMTRNAKEHKNTDIGLKSFTIEYPICEKIISTIESLKKKNIPFEETPNGYFLKDSDQNNIYLEIKR